jgi:hypothetical protein
MVIALLALVTLVTLVPVALASTCPSCPTSRAVAAIVCGADFWTNLGAILAPFPLFAALGALLYRIGRAASVDERKAA